MQGKVNLEVSCMVFLRTAFQFLFSFMNMTERLGGLVLFCFSDICLCELIWLNIRITVKYIFWPKPLATFLIPCFCLRVVFCLSLRRIHYLSFGLEGWVWEDLHSEHQHPESPMIQILDSYSLLNFLPTTLWRSLIVSMGVISWPPLIYWHNYVKSNCQHYYSN